MGYCVHVVLGAMAALGVPGGDSTKESRAEVICEHAERFGIDPLLVLSVAHHENPEWRVRRVYLNENGSRDYGLMQFNCPVTYDPEPWRSKWCTRRGKRLLLTSSASIEAGSEELFWKRRGCRDERLLSRAATRGLFSLYSKIDKIISQRESRGVSNEPPASYSRGFPEDSLISKYQSFYRRDATLVAIKRQRRGHGHVWVRHYNWHSPGGYALKVLFLYNRALYSLESNYTASRRRLQATLGPRGDLSECVTRSDACQREVDRWLERRQRRHPRVRRLLERTTTPSSGGSGS